MSFFKDKKILLGVCGGIAAYKIPLLVRLLVKEGAIVRVIMTEDAKQFVTEMTLGVLSKNEVYSNFGKEGGVWNSHVELGEWADVMIIAPATANTIGKMAGGICDNIVLATYFSCKKKVMFAPAMDLDMYKHPAVRENIAKLVGYGNVLIPSGYGELASGLVGEGRMAEPEEILRILRGEVEREQILKGKKILVTGGPTYEMIDPVRFVGNFSSGKMGVAIANAASVMGADVTLVLGPSAEREIEKGVKVVRVTSAEEMYVAANEAYGDVDIAILSAAVADYTPKVKVSEKIKKNDGELVIELVKTKDILASLGERKKDQKLIGFALETKNEMEYAKDKIRRKNLDGIVMNSLKDEGAGFGVDTNKVTFISKDMEEVPLELKSKKDLAFDIIKMIIKYC